MQPSKTCKQDGCNSPRYHLPGMARPVSRCKKHHVAYKAEYDRRYREKNADYRKAQKAAYFQRVYKEQPEKFKAIRTARMKDHVKYCRQESYKQYKKRYDLKSRWGEYTECWAMIEEILEIVLSYYSTKYERLKARGYYYRKYGFAEPIERYFLNSNKPA